MRKPNLFILGAPKCGTTSLMDWLGQHPTIYASPYKEPHFFYSPYSPPLSLKEYASLFARVETSHEYLAEGSTWYLFSWIAVQRILEFNPEARFILCLRNSLEMLPSFSAQKRLSGVKALPVLEDAWHASPERARGIPVGIRHLPENDPRHMAYKEACSLGSQDLKLLNQVDSRNVFFCFFEEI